MPVCETIWAELIDGLLKNNTGLWIFPTTFSRVKIYSLGFVSVSWFGTPQLYKKIILKIRNDFFNKAIPELLKKFSIYQTTTRTTQNYPEVGEIMFTYLNINSSTHQLISQYRK